MINWNFKKTVQINAHLAIPAKGSVPFFFISSINKYILSI